MNWVDLAREYKNFLMCAFALALGTSLVIFSPGNKDIGGSIIAGGLALYQSDKQKD